MDEQPKRPRGRPPAPPDTALDAKLDMRVSSALKAKIDRLGHAWVRRTLERAKPPRKPED